MIEFTVELIKNIPAISRLAESASPRWQTCADTAEGSEITAGG